MATPVKVGGYNDRQALNTAQQETVAALSLVERATDELERYRATVGRPDYGAMSRLLGRLSIALSRAQAALGVMAALREGGGTGTGMEGEVTALAARVAALEADVAELQEALR